MSSFLKSYFLSCPLWQTYMAVQPSGCPFSSCFARKSALLLPNAASFQGCPQRPSALGTFLLNRSHGLMWLTSAPCAVIPKSSSLAPNLFPRGEHLDANMMRINLTLLPSILSAFHVSLPPHPGTKPQRPIGSSSPATTRHLIVVWVSPVRKPRWWCPWVHALLTWI